MRLDLSPLFQDDKGLKRYLVTNFRRIQELFTEVENIAAGQHPNLLAHDELGLATQAELNTHVAGAGHEPLPSYQSYTPVVRQNGIRGLSSSLGRFCQINDQVHAYGKATVSNAGAAGNAITVSLPIAALNVAQAGTGRVDDTDVGVYLAMARVSGSEIEFLHTTRSDGAVIGFAPSFALAVGDWMEWNVVYEAV